MSVRLRATIAAWAGVGSAQVNYNNGASHEVITFLNGGGESIHPSDYIFV